MIFRIDPNKVLHTVKQQSEIYAGESIIDSIQILAHPSLLKNEITEYKYYLYFKSNAITEKSIELFISPEQQNGFYILQTTFDEIMTNSSGFLEIWVDIKDINSKTILKSSITKIHIKPSREQKQKNIEVLDDYKVKISALESKIKEFDSDFKKLKSEKPQAQPQFNVDKIAKSLKSEIISEVNKSIMLEINKIKFDLKTELSKLPKSQEIPKLPQLHKISETGSYKDLSDIPDIQTIVGEKINEILESHNFIEHQRTLESYGITDAVPPSHVSSIGISQHGLSDGKSAGFSSNDYTSNEKDKLCDIEPKAQVNTVNLSDLPVALSDLNNDCGFVSQERINEHNYSDISHNDIRELVENLRIEIINNRPLSLLPLLANIDYLTMFVGIDSVSVEKMKEYYDSELWDTASVRVLVDKNLIGENQYKKITGEDYYSGYSSRRRRRYVEGD